MDKLTDTRVKRMSDIIEDYLNCLNSIRDTFLGNFALLKRAELMAVRSFRAFITNNSINVEEDILTPIQAKEIKSIIKKVERAELATVIFPQSMLVSMVSQYDYLIGQLVQFVYDVNLGLLNDSNSQISFKEIFMYSDINAIKNKIVQDKSETILRKSHEEQISELQNISGVKNLKGVSFWKDFIEITQRRNLLVHCRGCVSNQYIQKCQEVGITSLPNCGDKLNVDEKYFEKAYFVFYTMGVLLSQVIIRHLLAKENVIAEIDAILTNVIYETLEEEKYDLAIELSKFALEKTTKHSNRLDEVYFVLNYAQAYKWKGEQQKCKDVLSEFDFSAMTSDILVAKYALEDDVEKVVENMKKTGGNSEIMTKNAYVSWVIFKGIRENEDFKRTYKEIFGEEIAVDALTEEENQVVKDIEISIQEK